jgi:hypothetical protein
MKIQPNELRVGSVIQWISTGNIDVVRDIVTFDKKECNVNNISISDVKGVELIEEILIKIGFVKERTNTYKKYNFDIDTSLLVYIRKEFCYWAIDGYPVSTIKYLHQLQNLFFTVMGEELPCNEIIS